MPQTSVVIYRSKGTTAPLLAWLDEQPKKVQDKFMVRIELLEERGHELRRPNADSLRDGIYELRVRHLRVNYRILYGFAGQRAVLLGGLTKERNVPKGRIEQALTRLEEFKADPERHTYAEGKS